MFNSTQPLEIDPMSLLSEEERDWVQYGVAIFRNRTGEKMAVALHAIKSFTIKNLGTQVVVALGEGVGAQIEDDLRRFEVQFKAYLHYQQTQ